MSKGTEGSIIPSNLAPPDNHSLVPVAEDLISTYVEGPLLIGFMQTLNLGLFSAPDGSWWVGLLEGDFHEHDRWLFILPGPKAILDFSRLRCETFYPCRPVAEIVYDMEQALDGPPSITDYLADVINTVSLADKAGNYRVPPQAGSRMLQALQAFGWQGVDQMRQVTKMPWGPDMHNLIHHPEVWAQAHPEAAGMPRELVLRMHGLSAYAAALARGDDWHVITEA